MRIAVKITAVCAFIASAIWFAWPRQTTRNGYPDYRASVSTDNSVDQWSFPALPGVANGASSGTDRESIAPKDDEATESADSAPSEALSPELSGYFRLIEARRTDVARIRLNNYLKATPDDGRAMFLFGLAYHREKRYALAREWFDKALAAAPDYALTNYFRGWCLYYLGKPDAARSAFEAYLGSSPLEPDVHFGLGLIDLEEDNLESARKRFETAMQLESAKPSPSKKDLAKHHARLGQTRERQDDWSGAKRELLIATELDPDAYEAFFRLSRVLTRLGEQAEADRAYADYVAARERIRPGVPMPAEKP